MKILSFVGTRPEIIKSLAFHRAAQRIPGLEIRFLHTGQNFGARMADCFFKDLGVPLDGANKDFKRDTPGAMAASLLDYVVSSIREHRPDVVISNTDTHSAFYTALGAASMKVPVAHFEGGIRCEARLNPEEINRRLADHLSTWIFPIVEEDAEALRGEGFTDDRIHMLGDITLDALRFVLRENKIPLRRGDYDLFTVHRQENVGDPERLKRILRGVSAGGHKTKFPVHPRTRQALEREDIAEILDKAGNIELLEPQDYVAMVRLAAGSRKIITDSGGLRREAYMLGKPVISLVWFVWFKRMKALGFKRTVDADPARIEDAIRNFDPPGERPALFGDGRAGEHILRRIMELHGS